MAAFDLGNGSWMGLSTDTKPAVAAGSRFYETDTCDNLVSDGTYWWLSGFPSPLSPRRIGILSPGPSIGNGAIGLCTNLSPATGAGSGNNTISFSDNVNGRYYPGITGLTVGNRGGSRQASYVSTRVMGPKVHFKFKLVTNTNQNFWLGFVGGSPTEPSGVDPLAGGLPGVLFGINSGVATNWSIMYNDTAGATNIDNTGIAYDTNMHTVNIVSDNPNSKFMWNLDGGAYTALSIPAQIPTTANGIGIIAEIETEETVSKSFQLYEMNIQTEI